METNKQKLAIFAGLIVLLSVLGGVLAGGSRLSTESPSASMIAPVREEIAAQSAPQDERAVVIAMLERAGATALAEVGSGRVTEIEVLQEDGSFEVEVLLNDGSEAKVFLNDRFEVTAREDASPAEDKRAINRAILEQATAAALEHTGGGRIMGIELGDAPASYEVDVILDGGRQVEVYLDEAFEVLHRR